MSPFWAIYLAVVLLLVVSIRSHRRKPAITIGAKASKQRAIRPKLFEWDRPAADAGFFGSTAVSPVDAEFQAELLRTTFPANALYGSLDHSFFARDKLDDLTRPLENKREEPRTLNMFELDKKDDLTRSFFD
jgi:hypothetical protein